MRDRERISENDVLNLKDNLVQIVFREIILTEAISASPISTLVSDLRAFSFSIGSFRS